MVDLEKRFTRLVNAAIKANGVNDVLADELRNMVSTVLDEEREHIAEQARQAQSDAIQMLEKKVNRLAGSLEESERERDKAKRRAAALEAAGGGVAGQAIFSEFDDKEDKQRKLELLKVVFDQNKEMRDQLKSQGVVIKARKKPQPVPADGEEEAAADDEAAASESQEEGVTAAVDDVAPGEGDGEAEAAELPEGEDPYADLVDPDDMPWQPGMKVQTDVAGDNEDDDDASSGGVKKIAAVQDREPPPITINKAGDAEADAAEDVADDSYDDLVDPDDLPWQPGTKVSSEVAGDNEEDEDDGGVKKISSFRDLEPPPISVNKTGE